MHRRRWADENLNLRISTSLPLSMKLRLLSLTLQVHPVCTAGSAVLPPYTIERVHEKFMDHQIGSDPVEYYLAIAHSVGRCCKNSGEEGAAFE